MAVRAVDLDVLDRRALLAQQAGVDATYAELDSPHGHDAFLIELEALGEVVTKFLTDVEDG